VFSPYLQCRRYALVALGNYAALRGSRVSLGEVDVVKSFMAVAADSKADAEERLAATYALSNAAGHEGNHARMVAVGLLLVKNVFDVFEKGSPDVRRFATLLLANFASTQYTAPVFAEPFVLAPLIKLPRMAGVRDSHPFCCTSWLGLIAL
jgi:hypothetical protein